ncbi:MAG: DUF4760 domain-containing protein [Candidatus Reddybacter sp.]
MDKEEKHLLNLGLSKKSEGRKLQKERADAWDKCKGRVTRLLALAPVFMGSIFSVAALAASEETEVANAASVSFWPMVSSQAFPTYFSTVMISGFAWLSIIAAKNRERKKNTFQMIGESSKDPLLQRAFKVVKELHEHEKDEVKQFANKHRHEAEEAVAIRYMLNHYEYVCIGMKMGVYDEDVLFTSQKTIILGSHSKCEQYIQELRTQTSVPTSYIEIEALAERWQDKKLKVTSAKKWQHKYAFWK